MIKMLLIIHTFKTPSCSITEVLNVIIYDQRGFYDTHIRSCFGIMLGRVGVGANEIKGVWSERRAVCSVSRVNAFLHLIPS